MVFRNAIFRDFVNLGLKLIEIDKGLTKFYDRVKGVTNSIKELEPLDLINNIPYLNIATSLVDVIIKIFGENENDLVWSNLPLLDIEPPPGVSFLRSGIYVAYEIKNSKKEEINYSDLIYKDGKVAIKEGAKIEHGISNCLVFSIRIRPFERNY